MAPGAGRGKTGVAILDAAIHSLHPSWCLAPCPHHSSSNSGPCTRYLDLVVQPEPRPGLHVRIAWGCTVLVGARKGRLLSEAPYRDLTR